MRKKQTPILEVHLVGARGVVVGDGRARSVPLATHRAYDMTLASVDTAGELSEVAATRAQPSAWKRLITALRG